MKLSAFAIVASLVVALGLLVGPIFLSDYGRYILSMWIVMSIAAIGLNLTLGYAGQVSLAQGAFMGVGAYVSALMTIHGWPLPVAMLTSALVCLVLGWMLGYPALRVQHHYLAFVTLAFASLAFLIFRNEEWITGGVDGLANIPRPYFLWMATDGSLAFYYYCLGVLGLIALGYYGLVRSPWGRAFLALRENPVRAMSLGIDTRRYILVAFAIGSALGGVAGSLFAPLVQFVEPPAFAVDLSLKLLLMVIVGGSGFYFGPFLGALIAVLLPEWLRFTQGYYLMLYAFFVMLLLVISPSGILGIADKWITDRKTRVASAARAATASAFEETKQ
ncbi:MAG: branched-chain amino acid ABC transporter permease [Hyphomicrobiales bacterium]|nr:branched-chain amino acid ABC transporter permease [Hyphomicrobiales bacterium]MDE2114536.1 branched-chain amino acid ABC transporter permease [Hyphomicrobiales bacterium]